MFQRKTMTLLAAVLVAAPASAQEESRRLVIPLDDPSRPARLEVSLVSGSIRVEAHEGSEVIVEIVSGPDETEVRQVDGMFRIPNNTVGLSAVQKDNKVSVDAEWGSAIEEIAVRVPRATSVHLSTVNGGDIAVAGLTGTHELDNVNGEIEALRMSGSVVASTTNGDVRVELLAVEAATPMSFTTWNGDVDVTFPAGFAADLRIKSHQGEILSDFAVDLDPNPAQVRREETGRGSRVEIEREVRGRVGGGGPEVRFETFNGDVLIRRGG